MDEGPGERVEGIGPVSAAPGRLDRLLQGAKRHEMINIPQTRLSGQQ